MTWPNITDTMGLIDGTALNVQGSRIYSVDDSTASLKHARTKCIDFDGATQYFSAPLGANNWNIHSCTVWVNIPLDISGDSRTIFWLYNNNSTELVHFYIDSSTGYLSYWSRDDSNNISRIDTTTDLRGTGWRQVGFTHYPNGNKWYLVVDGEVLTNVTLTGDIQYTASNTTHVYIGAAYSGGVVNFFKGKMAEIGFDVNGTYYYDTLNSGSSTDWTDFYGHGYIRDLNTSEIARPRYRYMLGDDVDPTFPSINTIDNSGWSNVTLQLTGTNFSVSSLVDVT